MFIRRLMRRLKATKTSQPHQRTNRNRHYSDSEINDISAYFAMNQRASVLQASSIRNVLR